MMFNPHGEEPRSGVSNHEARIVASPFETRFALLRVRERQKKAPPGGETGQGLEMSGRRCGSPDIQSNSVEMTHSITCTMRRVRGSTSTVEPLITV
jgi:hypothetical protein